MEWMDAEDWDRESLGSDEDSDDSQNKVFDYPSGSDSGSGSDSDSGSDSEDEGEPLELFPRKRARYFDCNEAPTLAPERIQWRPKQCGICQRGVFAAEGADLPRVAWIQRCLSNKLPLPNPPPGGIAIPQTCCDSHFVCRECLEKAWQWRHNWGPRLARCIVCGFGDSVTAMRHIGAWLVGVRGWVQWALEQRVGDT